VVPEQTAGYAVVVSKKIARLSVTRHRVKRQILGALRDLPTLPPSLIIFPKPAALRLDTLHVRADLAQLVGRALERGTNRRK
jgi:ribonuclease P protein component